MIILVPIITLVLMGAAAAISVIRRDIRATKAAIKPRKRTKHYIYFFTSRGENPLLVKIGRTNNYIVRLKAHKTANPYGLRVLGIVAVLDDRRAERFLHCKFRKNCIAREWFRLDLLLWLTILAIRDDDLTQKAREHER